MNIVGIIVSYVYIALVIIGAKVFEKRSKEASRKFIHIMLGNWWIIAMFFFDNVWFASFVPATFVIINYISCKKDIIKVMERDEKHKDGLGTVYYAVSLLIIAIVTFGIYNKPVIGLVPIFIMAYGDGLAAIFGKMIKSKEYYIGKNKKTIAGSITMFIISVIAFSTFLAYYNVELWFGLGVLFAVISTILEAVSIKGTDNLTVPLGALGMLLLVL